MIVHVTKSNEALAIEEYLDFASQTFAFRTGLPYIAFSKFIPLKDLLEVTGADELECVRFLRTSKKYKVLILDNGLSYVHPKDFIAILEKEIREMTIQQFI